jgi:phage gp36-like protein
LRVGQYIDQTDLEELYGTNLIEEWADPGVDAQVTDADIAARVARAIEIAEAELHDRLRGAGYTIPLVVESGGSLASVEDKVAALAAFNLYKRRGLEERSGSAGKMLADYKSASEWLNGVTGGQIKLGCARPTRGTVGPVVVTPGRAAASMARVGECGGGGGDGVLGGFQNPTPPSGPAD